jgi:hypothetical protein
MPTPTETSPSIRSLGYARKLGEALPDDPSVRQLLAELEGAQ